MGFSLFWGKDFSPFCNSLSFAVHVSTLLQNVSIWINQGSIFIHPHLCSSQESHLKIEALSNQVKAASEEIMIRSRKTQIHFNLFSPIMRKTPYNVFWQFPWNCSVSILVLPRSAPTMLPFIYNHVWKHWVDNWSTIDVCRTRIEQNTVQCSYCRM